MQPESNAPSHEPSAPAPDPTGFSAEHPGKPRGKGVGPVTKVIIAANVIVWLLMLWSGASLMNPDSDLMIRWGANFGPYTLSGEWWRVFSSMFLHFGIIHLGVNMWALWQLGALAEAMLGPTLFLFVYLLTGVSGSLLSLAVHPRTVSAGASGAIFGIVGLLISLFWLNYLPLPKQVRNPLLRSVVKVAAYNLLIGLAAHIDNAAHIGGLIFGLLLGALLCLMRRASYDQKVLATLATSVLLLGGFVGARDFRHSDADFGRAVKAANRKDWQSAEHYSRLALDADSRDQQVMLLLAYSQRRAGHEKDAAETYLRLLAQNPKSIRAQAGLAEMYLDHGDTEKAEPLLRSALAVQPKAPELHVLLGKMYDLRNQDAPALEEFKQALSLDPNDPDAYVAMGHYYVRIQQPANAKDAFKKALELDPQNEDARQALEQLPQQ